MNTKVDQTAVSQPDYKNIKIGKRKRNPASVFLNADLNEQRSQPQGTQRAPAPKSDDQQGRGDPNLADRGRINEPCRRFQRGVCSNGSVCRYLHGPIRQNYAAPSSSSSSSSSRPGAPQQRHQLSRGDGRAGGRGDSRGGSKTASQTVYSVCVLCGQRTTPSLRCCKGEAFAVKRDFPSKQLTDHCLQSARRWTTSDELGAKVDRCGQQLLSFTTRSAEVERDLVNLFRSVCAADMKDLELSGHCTRPWAAHASDMTDAKSMTELFGLESQRMRFSSKDMKAAVGGVLHGLLDQACAHGSAAAAMSDGWTEAVSHVVTVDEAGVNIRVSGTSDALFRGIPVELKTISTKKGGSLTSSKVGKWLTQLAVYQYAHPDRSAVLVVVCRDTCTLKAFEVSPENTERANRIWRGIMRQDSMLPECFALSRPYMDALQHFPKSGDRKLFLGVGTQAKDLLRRHAERLLGECIHAVETSPEATLACRCFMRARRCMGLLLGPNQSRSKGRGKGNTSLVFPKREGGLQRMLETARERLLSQATQDAQQAEEIFRAPGIPSAALGCLLASAMVIYGTVLGEQDPLTKSVRIRRKEATDRGLIVGALEISLPEFDEEGEPDVEAESECGDPGDAMELEGEMEISDCDFAMKNI